MAFLHMLAGNGEGRRFEIDRDETVIGRAPGNEFVIEDPSVSGRHCRITRRGRTFTLIDLGSTNGTQLNGVPVTERRLNPGDAISAGSVDLVFDGDDIDPFVPSAGQPATTRLASGSAGGHAVRKTPAAFNARKNRKWIVMLLAFLGTVVALAAMALFLHRLLAA